MAHKRFLRPGQIVFAKRYLIRTPEYSRFAMGRPLQKGGVASTRDHDHSIPRQITSY
jgi:hypothetical protein